MRFAEIGHALCGEGSDSQDSQERNGWAFHKHMKLLKGAVRQERITKKSRISGAFVS
jgi:hypothetical protein